MGVAHMLGLPETIPELARCGPRYPLMPPGAVHLFGFDPVNATAFELEAVRSYGVPTAELGEVRLAPSASAGRVLLGWASEFDRIQVHLDVDVVDFGDLPLAENYTRNNGLRYAQALAALRVLLASPKLAGLTVTEVNPDHGAEDGSTIRGLARDLSALLSHPEL